MRSWKVGVAALCGLLSAGPAFAQAPALASALTGGAAIHQGVQMLQNVLMVMGLRAVASGGRSLATATGAGGVIRGGAGVPLAIAHHWTGLARAAAYKLAALRGRN